MGHTAVSTIEVSSKRLLSEGLSEPEFYGDLVYKFKKLIGINDFSFQFRKIVTRHRCIGYNVVTPVGRASDSMMAPTLSYSF